MFKNLLESVKVGIKEQYGKEGDAYKISLPLDSPDAKYLYPRLNAEDKWKVGDIVYLRGSVEDDDGFDWVTLVKDKSMLSAQSYASHDKGTITVTPSRSTSFYRVFQPIEEQHGFVG